MRNSVARAFALRDYSIASGQNKATNGIQHSGICLRCRARLSHLRRSSLETSHYPRNFTRRSQSTWTAAFNAAQSFFNNGGTSSTSPKMPGGIQVDPLRTVAKEMKFLTNNMRDLIGSGHPMLDTVAKYYTKSEGKHIRPMLVLLMSQATACISSRTVGNISTQSPFDRNSSTDPASIDEPLTPPNILSDINPSNHESPLSSSSDPTSSANSDVLPSQRRLAEITELIHTASLLHDDVVDTSRTRRNAPSANIAFGNKMAVLAGDFLLGRASVALARLRDPQVTELLATVIANLVEGEFLQLRNTARDEPNPRFAHTETIPYYLRKTYLKSASLISKSCRAAALLGGHGGPVADAAYAYGKNLGLAFQLVDDMLDFTGKEKGLGKPAGADLELGLATAPLLFAWRGCEELGRLVGRRFGERGDVERARELVRGSDGVEQTRALAQSYADKAGEAIEGWPESEGKTGLREMCGKVMQRKK